MASSSVATAVLEQNAQILATLLTVACGLLLLAVAKRRAAPHKPAAEAVLEVPGLAFPMWVVPIRTMLELATSACSGSMLPTHDELQEQGLLVRWQPGMNTMFLSHTWLGYEHPDPKGVKCRLIVALLEGILAGRTKVTGYWVASVVWNERGVTAKELTSTYADGFVWMDYLSIPQRDRITQGLAIQSITGYVARATDFIVLAGPWKHDDGSVRDVRAWCERGWCRMEQLANGLSPRQKSMIVAQSPTNVFSHGPSGIAFRSWNTEPVGKGAFTVESDKAKLGPAILQLINARKAQCDRDLDIVFFRYLSSISSFLLRGTGVQLPDAPLDEWLAQLRFSGPCDDEKSTGLSPLRFAVIANRADLVAQLLQRGADIECRTTKLVPKHTRWLFQVGSPVLMDCCQNGHDHADCLKLLLSHGVNVRTVTTGRPHGSALNIAIGHSNYHLIEPLLAADPTLWQLPHFNTFLPFEQALQSGTPECARYVLDNYADQLQGLPAGVPVFLDCEGHTGIGAAHTAEWMRRSRGVMLLWTCVNHIGDTRVLKMVLDAGHDPNGDLSEKWTDPSKRKLPLKIWQWLCELRSEWLRNPEGIHDKMGNWYCSPLHMAALTGNLGAVEMLLDYGAKPESQMHKRQLTPLHLAAMGGHDSCVDALLRKASARVNLAAIRDSKGLTPAYRAARRGHAELAARLARLELGGVVVDPGAALPGAPAEDTDDLRHES